MTISNRAGILAVGVFAIVAGCRRGHRRACWKFSRHLESQHAPSFTTALVGAFYSLGGASILTLQKWGAALGIVFIGAEIAGRIYLVGTGLAPSSGADLVKIIIGGATTFAVVAYVAFRRRKFS